MVFVLQVYTAVPFKPQPFHVGHALETVDAVSGAFFYM